MKERRLAIDSRDSVDENDHCALATPGQADVADSAERPPERDDFERACTVHKLQLDRLGARVVN